MKPEEADTESSIRLVPSVTNPLISVIIPVYNGVHQVTKCIEALRLQSVHRGTEVIIVDNGSTDGTWQLLESLRPSFPNLVLHRENEIRGSYAARNLGIHHSKGKFLAFTDIDCQPVSDWLERCLDHVSRENTIIAGDIEVFPENARPNIFELLDMHSSLQQKTYAQAGYGATANLLVPRKVFDTVGLFSLVTSGGDNEFCRRAGRTGVKVVFDERLVIRHPARSTSAELVTKARRIGLGNAQNLGTLAGPWPKRVFFIVRQFIGIFLPRHQFRIVFRITTDALQLTTREKVSLLIWAIYIGNLQRLSFLKALLLGRHNTSEQGAGGPRNS